MSENGHLSLVLFSGTDDKLESAAIMAAGAAAIGTPVNILLQFWALDAFRADRIDADHGLAAEAGTRGADAVRERTPAGRLTWADTLRQAKELGEVEIHACTNSLELLGIDATELDPLVDGASGIATFFLAAEGGPIVFI
jgi:peroxiredoxin family protein